MSVRMGRHWVSFVLLKVLNSDENTGAEDRKKERRGEGVTKGIGNAAATQT